MDPCRMCGKFSYIKKKKKAGKRTIVWWVYASFNNYCLSLLPKPKSKSLPADIKLAAAAAAATAGW